MTEPILSVCLITYNHEKYILNAIEGALMQKTNFSYEIVIGEDASTDKTREICEKYALKYPDIVKLLPSKKNLGLNENFLRTIKACKGKYVAYLEGDDYWITNNKLQKQFDILEKYKDVVYVHTDCSLIDLYTSKIVQEHLINLRGGINFCVRENSFGINSVINGFEGKIRTVKPSTSCYRKDLFLQILKEDSFSYLNKDFPTQDFQLINDMAFRGRFYYIDEITTYIGLHDSISASKDLAKQIKFNYGFFLIGIRYIEKYNLPKSTIQIWGHKQFSYFLYFAIRNRKYRKYISEAYKKLSKLGYKMNLKQKIAYYYCFILNF